MIVDYKNVNIFTSNAEILHDVNLEAGEGDFIFLIGKVGSGKTTLLRSMYGMAAVEGGKARVLDFDLLTLKRKHLPELRRREGIIFQNFELLPDRTVYANLEFVLRATGWKKADIGRRIDEVLREVGLTDKIEKFPHELSGGEQQRLTIGRAILNNPQLILADEPTGNLDPETGKAILDILYHRARGGTTVIMSTHNLHLLPLVEARILKCEDGGLHEVSGGTKSLADSTESEEAETEEPTEAESGEASETEAPAHAGHRETAETMQEKEAKPVETPQAEAEQDGSQEPESPTPNV